MNKRSILLLPLVGLSLASCTAYNYQEYYPYPRYRTPGATYTTPYYYRKAPVGGGSATFSGEYSGSGSAESFQAVETPSSYSY